MASTATAPPTPRSRLGRPFGALTTGVLTSNASDGFVFFAAPLLVLTITKDPVAVAAVTAVTPAGPALFRLLAGALAHPPDRRPLMAGAPPSALAAAVRLPRVATDTKDSKALSLSMGADYGDKPAQGSEAGPSSRI